MIKRLLIANRGEIACRIIKTAKKMGITTIAIYSEAENNPLHAELADESYCIGAIPLSESYLNQDKIIKLAKHAKADAIHPGYGFLSENANFSALCDKNHIVFIGPTSKSIQLMGKKDDAKIFLKKSGISTVPGYDGQDQNTQTLYTEALRIELPVLIKAAAGGGGKGMRKIFNEDEILPAIEAAKREAKNSFGDDKLIIEKYLPQVRHIEVQVIRDKFGNCLHLFERDCSVQRRHQKIIEEAPAPIEIPTTTKQALYHSATKIADLINYEGAGTIEYLYCEDTFYFLEMNTRIQVEHPITELITGIDLVQWQIMIANSQPLPLKQTDLSIQGHAIEARIYAEDAFNQFLPTTGTLESLILPDEKNGIRIDTGVRSGDKIGIHFDPMIAKLSVHAPTRTEAIHKLNGALKQFATFGLTTNLDFLINLVNHDDYQNAKIHTHTLDQDVNPFLHDRVISDLQNILMAGIFHFVSAKNAIRDPQNIFNQLRNWRLNHIFSHHFNLKNSHDTEQIQIKDEGDHFFIRTEKSTKPHRLEILKYDSDAKSISFKLNNETSSLLYHIYEHKIWILWEGNHIFGEINPTIKSAQQKHDLTRLLSPMPGVIRHVFVSPEQEVKLGEKLIALEAMKMEHTLTAEKDVTIKKVNFKIGDQVEQGKELITFHE